MKTQATSMAAALWCLLAIGCDGGAVYPLEAPPIDDASGVEATADVTGIPPVVELSPEEDILSDDTVCAEVLPYATELVSFTPGLDAGFGQTKMPGVVLGPPAHGPPTSASLDVVSLGAGGEIVVGFSERTIVDGPGPDLIVWENPFWVGGDPNNPYAELGEVAVSEDGETWVTFPCDPHAESHRDPACAGWRARQAFEACTVATLDPEHVGGDPFDLADIGVSSARYVRIRDLEGGGGAPSAGFDLDAVGAIHLAP